MRAFLEIVRFELRYQRRSILFPALVAVIAAIHFFSARKTGLDISLGASTDAATLAYNAGLAIVQNELVLSLLGVLPALALVATAITRDHERETAELFYAQPIPPVAYIAGRFAGALPFALIVALAGLAGNFVSLVSPGIDPALLGPTTAAPWLYALMAIVLPNTFILAALIFAAAAMVRSIAGAYCAALILPLIGFGALSLFSQGGGEWLALADPFGFVAVADVTRYWTRPELVSRLPGGIFWINRLLWLVIAGAVLVFTVLRYRFAVAGKSLKRRTTVKAAPAKRFAGPTFTTIPRFGPLPALAQFASQLRMDMRAILRSPVFYLIALLVAAACVGEVNAPSAAGFNLPQLPLTGRLVPFLDVGLAMQLFFAIAYFAGLLVHRERMAHLDGIADAAPVATISAVLSKLAALLLMVALLLGTGVATFVLAQLAAGHRPIEPGLWLAGMAIYGFNQYVLVVPALFLHLLVRNRWLGTLLFLAALIGALSLPPLGFENVLAGIGMAPPLYSEMNGFGPFLARNISLMAYWSAVMALIAVIACLAAPRGLQEGARARLKAARERMTAPMLAAAVLCCAAAIGAGAWIHYNTHVLNRYVTSAMAMDMAADYERRYRRYEGLWAPRPTGVDVALDFYPSERRLESRGTMTLVNDSGGPIRDLIVTINPALQIDELALRGAMLVERNDHLNVRRYRFEPALGPGAGTIARWKFSWRNRGFANGITTDTHLAANGSYVEARDVMPVLGYDPERELDGEALRRRHGLRPARRLPSLDDPAARADLRDRSQLRADVHVRMSTSADQLPVTSGALRRQWTEGGRRHAEYAGRLPLPIAFVSARYEVVYGRAASGVPVEVYFDAAHRRGASPIMRTATRGLAYYAEQFGPYPQWLGSFRVVEYPSYWKSTHSEPGVVFYDEGAGFSLDYPPGAININLAHELAHTWWDLQLHGAQVQGKDVLAEALPTYSALMLIEHAQGRAAVQPYLDYLRDLYLDRVSREEIELQPVVRGETALNSYLKGSLVLYTLRDALGADAVNGALRGFLADHAGRPPPNPTMRDLVAALRAAAGPSYQPLITDLFEKITFYDVAVRKATVRKVAGGYDIAIDVSAGKRYAEPDGRETTAPLDAPFDIAVFGADGPKPLYLAKHWLKTGTQRILVHVNTPPRSVAVDPYGMMLDRRPDDNTVEF